MFTIHEITTPSRWDAALTALPNAHVLQSWGWGEFKSRWGWTPTRLLWQRGDAPAAAAQILARPIPRTPWRFLYVSKGPALDYADADLSARVLADLEQHTRRSGGMFLKIDPDVLLGWGEPGERPPQPAGEAWQSLLAERGWHFSPEQIQFRNTVLVDLHGEPDDWLGRIKSKWRYNIRLAEKRGVIVRAGGPNDNPAFHRMYAETAARDGFLIRPEAYYRDVWSNFLASGQATLLLAEVESQPVAGLILFIFGQRAWYMYGASTGQHRNLMPNHLLQWSAMRHAAALGCTSYDMWGAPDVFDESDGMWGVYRFKQGFGGQTALGLGAWDYPARPGLYRLFTNMMPRARALLRRVSRTAPQAGELGG